MDDVKDTKNKEVITHLVEIGCDVCFANNRVYKTLKGEYVILRFDENANIKMDKEESFDNVGDAVSKFIQHSKGKL